MRSFLPILISAFWSWLLLIGIGSSGLSLLKGEESRDVAIRTDRYRHGREYTPNYYFNEWPVGKGREGFQVILERVAKLPAGTSVVWGPDYDRCGSCSGSERRFHSAKLYSDLWSDLLTLIAKQQLTLSSDYPGPFSRNAPRAAPPTEIFEQQSQLKENMDASLEWELVLHDPPSPRDNARIYHAGKLLDTYEVKMFLSQLKLGSRLLLTIKLDSTQEAPNTANLARILEDGWTRIFDDQIGLSQLKTFVVAPAAIHPAWNMMVEEKLASDSKDAVSIQWSNFHGPSTPPDEVLYTANGRYLGRGDVGFDAVLAIVKALPKKSSLHRLGYEYRGRWASETIGFDRLDAINEKLARVVPYAERWGELDRLVEKRKLRVTVDSNSPIGAEPLTVKDWQSGDTEPNFFASGRMLWHDEKFRPGKVLLGWTDYNAADIREGRKLETTAMYTLNGQNVGRGVPGFVRAMEEIEKLPPGSVIQVIVCARTKGPFTCPIVYYGQRHYERTGFEPYFGMFDFLIDVAKKQRLEIEWIPDEKPSCQNCELNK